MLLNLTPDHLDRHGTHAGLPQAKLQIFAHQGADDLAVLPRDLAALAGVRRQRSSGVFRRRACSATRLGATTRRAGLDELRLRGAHNLQNAMAAAAVCLRARDRPRGRARRSAQFAGVAHRLEEVARHEGVLYVNDSKATNVASTLVALRPSPTHPFT